MSTIRVLFTTQPGFGHWHPLVPIAHALMEAGHEVAFATTPAFSATIADNGFQAFPVGTDETDEELRERREQLAEIPGPEQAVFMWTEVFAGSRAKRTLSDVLAIGREWRPDVLVRDMTEFACYVAAESLGLPHAAVQVAAFRPDLHKLILPQINRLRATAGLDPVSQLEELYPYFLLSLFPPGYLDPTVRFPPTTHSIRYTGFDSSGGKQLPDWVQHLPDRPTVYATLGTVFNHLTGVLRAILDGLRDEPVNLILTTGHNVEPSQFGIQPPHIHVERYIPQSLLLPHCDLVITHGGSGTVRDALSQGLPMVIIPIAADQHANAKRCSELEVARVIEPGRRTPEAIRAATQEALGNPRYRQNAERLRKEIRALPGMEHAVALLERLAIERAPLIGDAP